MNQFNKPTSEEERAHYETYQTKVRIEKEYWQMIDAVLGGAEITYEQRIDVCERVHAAHRAWMETCKPFVFARINDGAPRAIDPDLAQLKA